MLPEYVNDLDTPTEADLDAAYGSKYLSASDLGDRKVRTRIVKVRPEDLRQQNGTTRRKFVLFFSTLDKALVLNVTNKDALVQALGKPPANWLGAEIGLLVEPTMMAGKSTKGVRLRVLDKPATAAAPAPKPARTSTATEVNPWPDQSGDPGFDPDLNGVPDFEEVAV